MQNFDLRLYGFIINEVNGVLVSDECKNGIFFTKFPGGGVEFGEGIEAALKREFIEELAVTISEAEPFYFTDFYSLSPFEQNCQLVAFYYLVELESMRIEVSNHSFPFYEEGEKQRWVSIQKLNEEEITFEHDRIAFEKLRSWAQKKEVHF